MRNSLFSVVLLLPLVAAAKPPKPVETVVVRAVAWDASWKPAGPAEWVERAAAAVAAAVKGGADIVVFPEGFTAGLGSAESATRTVEDSLYPALKTAAGKSSVVLGAYARSVAGDASYRVAVLDGGAWGWFDKNDLTPAETAALPGVKPGFRLPLFKRAGGLWGVIPGYTLQKTEAMSQVKRRGLQLIVSPASAGDANGATRVLRVATSRAVELGAAVVVAAPAGSTMYLPAQDGFEAPPEGAAEHRVPWRKLLELRERATPAAKSEARPFLDPTSLHQIEL
jgi:predicted amidohydrolase